MGSVYADRVLTGLQGEKDIFVHLNRIIALHKNARVVSYLTMSLYDIYSILFKGSDTMPSQQRKPR